MGSLSHLFDFNSGSMAKKVLSQKRDGSGLEAPRNSLELLAETSPSYCAVGDNIPYSYEIKRENFYPTEASMKKLINEEISKGPKTRRNAPSVVARLMGMDTLPLDPKSVSQQIEKKKETPGINFPNREQNKKGSGGHAQYNSNSSMQIGCDSSQHTKGKDPNRQSVGMKSKMPRPREHPQEEELQKFKKEFEAWQAARFRECSKVVELGRIPSQWLAQETLNKEKYALYANTSRITASDEALELKGHAVKARSREGGGLQSHGHRKEVFEFEKKEPYMLRSRTLSRDFELSPLTISGQNLDRSSAPTRIVILRPGPERISNNEESWVSSSGTSEERGSLEDFLEEVKERLKCELQGKSKKGTVVRWGGIETPHSEKPSDPKQIAQRIAKQVRESVTRDLGMNLLRSESTRSYKSEIQYNGGPGSPEFINRDTRRLLAERLRNVLKGETNRHIPRVSCGSSNSSMLDNERDGLEQSVYNLKAGGKLTCWDIEEEEPETQMRSFRRGPDGDAMCHRDLSPRNLIRSMSAPVSGTSFGKLLLEDRHILTGAHIRRKHESIECMAMDVKKRKERFKFKEKVSSFKYSFTIRGRLFRRKTQSAERPHKYEWDSIKDITSGPTVVMNFAERHENSTEVPPSPASVCSSVHDELWRTADHLSSTSTSDLSPLEDAAVPQVFREISSNLNELRRQLKELDADGPKEIVIEEQPSEAEREQEDEAEAYIRDLLVASGLYYGSFDKVLSRWDPLAKPISNQIFEEVEESHGKIPSDNEGSKRELGEKKLDHKLLVDLLNEALSTVLGPPVTMSRFRKKAIGRTPRPPRGRKLLDRVWRIVRSQLEDSPTDKSRYSLDVMVFRDLGSTPWSGLMSDDIDDIGKEVASQMTGDLIEEIVKDMQS